ncbi:structural maintenance of chromosomes flexible hinge domain-containing 1 [Plakobranchus ocellatus]|uniref:Structural maintenance of chromosomes flexible hinge domain-containing 1 n=1 Tax=Plakobranchus ocellatus TaxID=259542 RepID=A0AAV3YXH0_9GAST|nr:structural maintenance of chromosomes flexible hinge domain-containing 1 [Plakobranchus ocellatus]
MKPDAKKQQQMSALSEERDALRGTVQAYKSIFDTQQQLIGELRGFASFCRLFALPQEIRQEASSEVRLSIHCRQNKHGSKNARVCIRGWLSKQGWENARCTPFKMESLCPRPFMQAGADETQDVDQEKYTSLYPQPAKQAALD